MSLIMDVLEKFKGERKGRSVHPFILKKLGKGRSKKPFLILVLLFIASSLLAYALTDHIINSKATAGNFEEKAMEKRKGETESQEVEATAVTSPSKVDVKPEPQVTTIENEIEQKEIRQAKLSSLNPKGKMKNIVKDTKSPKPRVKERIRRKPEDTTALLLEADRYFKKGNLRKSLEYYERAYRVKRLKSIANNLLMLYVKLGEKEKAREIITIHRDERLIYTYLVEIARSECPREAFKESERFLAYDNKGYVYFARGYISELIGDYEEALKNYRIAFSKDQTNPYFSLNYARMLEATGDLLKASEIYQKLKNMNLEPNIRNIIRERLSYYRRLEVLK